MEWTTVILKLGLCQGIGEPMLIGVMALAAKLNPRIINPRGDAIAPSAE